MQAARSSVAFDHYAVERPLGEGAMGVVYLARDVRIGRLVALKTLQLRFHDASNPNAIEFMERFRREAELCGSLSHPNIVTLYEVGYEARRVRYLAMEYVEGETLFAMLQREKKLPLDAALRIADDVLAALAYAHARGVVHRDIKPANIILSVDGMAKLTDFGIARGAATTGELTENGQLIGTPQYMAPEHIAGRPSDSRADLFSLGVVLYELITGKKPFDGDDIFEVLYRVVNDPVTPASRQDPSVPVWVSQFLSRLLAKAPGDRFLSADAARRELRRLMEVDRRALDTPLQVQSQSDDQIRPEDTPTTPIFVPVIAERQPLLHRRVHSGFALGVVATLLIAAAGASAIIWNRIDETPTEAFAPGQLRRLEERRRELHEAELLASVGAWKETRIRLEAYVAKYPESTRARNRLEEVRRAEELQSAYVREVEVKARPSRRAEPAEPRAEPAAAVSEKAPPQRRSVWTRVRGWFRRG